MIRFASERNGAIVSGAGRALRRSREPETFPVSPLDAAHAGMSMCMALQTVDIRDDAAAVLDQIAATDPRHRVGLIPDPATRDWRIQPNPGDQLVLEPCRDHGDSLEATLQCMPKRRPPGPIAIWQCGSYTCIYCDHGLGDVRTIQKLGALFTNPALTGAWFMSREAQTNHPLIRALAHACRSRPRQLYGDVLETLGLTLRAALLSVAGSRAGDIGAAPAASPDRVDLLVVFVDGGLVEDLRRHRDDHDPGVSLSAVLMHRAYESFAAVGVPMHDSVDVPIDLRRYLPAGMTTPGNFQTLVRVRRPSGTSVATFAASLKREIESFTPLLLLARWLALTRVRRVVRGIGRHRSVSHTEQAVLRPLTLTLVDNTRWLDDAAIKWRHPERSVFVGMVPPETENHVAITFTFSGGTRVQATATFHASRVDPGTVRRALKNTLVLPS